MFPSAVRNPAKATGRWRAHLKAELSAPEKDLVLVPVTSSVIGHKLMMEEGILWALGKDEYRLYAGLQSPGRYKLPGISFYI